MVIVASKEGQIGNRMWHASNFLASAMAHGYTVRYLHFNHFKKYFSESINSNRGLFPIRFGITGILFIDSFLSSVLSLFLRACTKAGIKNLLVAELVTFIDYKHESKPFDLNDPVFVEKAKKKNLVIYGWQFNDPENMKLFAKHLRKFWTPDKKYLASLSSIIANAKKDSNVLVGVHIRRRDYRSYLDGIWYYDLHVYAEKMKQLLLLENFQGKKISFLVCSDEKIDESAFNEFDCSSGERHFIEDLYGLARCDYILGPPSTFSMWSSFYGNTPLLMIREKGQQVRMEDFRIVT